MTLRDRGQLTLLPEGVSDALFEEGRRLRQLALRVRDDELRRRYDIFLPIATAMGVPGHPDVGDLDRYMLQRFMPAQLALEDRLGEVLRPLL
jgi:hypothetical protein